MNILLSAYACSPILGSEPGVGWRWALELSKHHTVTVLTHPFFEEAITAALQSDPNKNLRVVYYEPQGLGVRRKRGSLNPRWYYIAWQIGACRIARQLIEREKFGLIHHITWGTYRFPSFMGFLDVPFVMGPVGGGEMAPMRLLRYMPFKDKLREFLRNLVVLFGKFDPIGRICLSRATLVLCKTEESARGLPIKQGSNVVIAQEIGAPECVHREPVEGAPGKIHLMYAGRLVGLKGVHFAIRAIAIAVSRGIDAKLTIIGDGPLESHLQTLAKSLGIGQQVQFKGFMPQQELLGFYQRADAFLFPSLHDSSGNVVVEALSRGVPVICLDLGGPKYFVSSECGRIIRACDIDADTLCTRLAEAIVELAQNPKLRAEMSEAALLYASKLGWRAQVNRVYELIRSRGVAK